MITHRHFVSDQTGFTLIELMITITLVSILTLFAMPSYQKWIANSRVRTTAESIQNGLMLAKAQALSRNTKVEFVITNTSPVVANVATVTASTSGSGWMVRFWDVSLATPAWVFIQGRSAAEGGAKTTVAAAQSTYVFTGTGVQPSGAVNSLINVCLTGTTCPTITAGTTERPLRIKVSTGGAIRMCDPRLDVQNTAIGC